MIFKCKNCGGNTVYSPERKKMYCPYCDSESSEEKQVYETSELTVCPNCGGEVKVFEHTSATQCPYCDNYLIFDERVEGEYLPKMILPFQMGKEVCKNAIREKFKKCLFAPTDFLSEVRLNGMIGTYVPFWLYDYDAVNDFEGEGTKVRTWRSGNTEYREVSYYAVHRNMSVDFRRIPVDASVQMPDEIMDLLEPFGYNQMEEFKPEYMSGFYGEKYNMPADVVEERAKKKMKDDISQMMQAQCSGYSSLRTIRNDVQVNHAEQNYALLPVWKYDYQYNGKDYPFYVNGQTGKIVGSAPISTKKVFVYGGTLWACLTILLASASALLKVL